MSDHRVLHGCLAAVLLCAAPGAARAVSVDLASPELVDLARATRRGEPLRVSGVVLGAGASPATLELARFELFAPDARVIVHGEGGETTSPPPANAYFRGSLVGAVEARAALSVLATGEVRGMLAGAGRFWILSNRLEGAALSAPMVREIDPAELAVKVGGFRCDTDSIASATELLHAALPPVQAPLPAPLGGGPAYSATVAIETDFEYFQLFGNSVAAADYAADLMAYSNLVYGDEVATEIRLGDITLWTTAADPWQEFGTTCGLLEFGRFWNDNHGDVQRTIAHFLSGKNNGGGVAWVGVLCSDEFNYNTTGLGCATLTPAIDNYGGDYGYSGTLDGNFDLGNPTVVWDVVVTAHEMGHNFNSPHTHCYNGIGGSNEPVDMCYGQQAGCYSGGTSLPGPACPGAGQGCGTIMSYCHLLGGGISNISWTFGAGHPYGVLPDRVPDRMNASVVATNAADPSCLPTATTIFTDGFESGNTSVWDQTTN